MNVFGERQRLRNMLLCVFAEYETEESITVHSNSAKTEAGSRHYIHAKDVADAMLFLLTKERKKTFEY